MNKYKIVSIVKDHVGQGVVLDGNNELVNVCGMHDIQVGDNFYVLNDIYGDALAYVCRDNLWFKWVPFQTVEYGIKTFEDNFKSVSDFSLDRWRYKRALKRAVKKLGMTPTNNAATNLRLWMSKKGIAR